MPPLLEQVRNYSLASTFLLLPVLVVVGVFGAVNNARPPWDAIYVAVALLLICASTTFTITAIALGMRHTRQEAATGHTWRRGGSALNVVGIVALGANLAAVGLSGHVYALNVVLAVLVGALLVLLQERARRQGARDRTR